MHVRRPFNEHHDARRAIARYAHTGMMEYAEYWFGFSLLLPLGYSVGVDSIHFQVGGTPCPSACPCLPA